jgi:phosphatidylinositol kinase/protein kinase (PI-3  family)
MRIGGAWLPAIKTFLGLAAEGDLEINQRKFREKTSSTKIQISFLVNNIIVNFSAGGLRRRIPPEFLQLKTMPTGSQIVKSIHFCFCNSLGKG